MTVKKSAARAARPVAAKQALLKTAGEDTSYDYTLSPDGATETLVLMHSRMGIRIEFNVNQCALTLWISPQAGKSVDYRDRNFSCRDDHTCIFDRISFPELAGRKFTGCDYDAFHSVLNFEGQKLHVASLLDRPVVLVWAESPEVVDFKSDKQDAISRRTPRVFGVRHPDRGKLLTFCAALGKGKGEFAHQPEVDAGRSTYARVVLAARQLLVIGGELETEKVEAIVTGVAAKPVAALLAENERQIAAALLPGTVVIRDNPEMQKLYDANKRHLLSAQDASGAIRAALKYVYYLIWSTDGSVTATHVFQTGWHDFLTRWLGFLLANPTSQEAPPAGRFFGQLVNGKITKREEFGSLCAVWAAFMHWGLTGDDRFVSGQNLRVLEDAVDWLDRYCFDPEVGGLGTFYFGGGSEDPFYGSNDFGFDAAVGCPIRRDCYAPRYQGRIILRGYEFGMNLNQYNMYLMLAARTSGAKSAAYARRAGTIEKFLLKLLDENARAYYRLDGGALVPAPVERDREKSGLLAVQSESPAFFMPAFARLFMNRQAAFKPLTTESVKDKMPCYVYGLLAGLDTEFVSEDQVFASLEATLIYNIRPSRFMPMAYTMVETLGLEGGEWHDIRPQAFSAGPFQGAVANLGVRTMPFGIALRGSRHLAALRHYEYRHGHLDIRYTGRGKVRRILLNGKPLEHTLQVPDARVRKGANAVVVELAAQPPAGPVLIYSTVRLIDTAVAAQTVSYKLECHCQNVLIFRGVPEGVREGIRGVPAGVRSVRAGVPAGAAGTVIIRDARGREVPATHTRQGAYLFVEFPGRGQFVATVSL
jgi:hypothetical protein